MFENKKIFILGMARSGYNIAKLLASKNEILITDQKDQDEDKVKELESLNVKFVKIDNPTDLLDESYDYVIKNPGIMPFHETLQKAERLDLPILNEMEVAYHYLPKNITIIGVTGSNGKTTTTTMIYDVLNLMHKPVVLGGNIGYPLSEVIYKIKENDILLLEISDHQLINFKDFKTNISVLTNLCPTHLDYHGTYENYINVKKNIFNKHTNLDTAIINKGNADSLKIIQDIASCKEYFNSDDTYVKDNMIYLKGKAFISLDDINVKGMHNYENIMAMLLVVSHFDLQEDVVKDYLKTFNGVSHRMEFVCENKGVKYYNDSKATNPTSTVTALSSFSSPVHLILGGMERKQDFHELDKAISSVKKIYAIGEVTDKVSSYAESMHIPCEKCYDLKTAISKLDAQSGDVVLLSPASASWDQYAKFEDRGDEFKKLVKDQK